MTATTTERRGDAADLLAVIGDMLADGDLGRLLDAAGDRGAQLRVDLLLAILDALLPDADAVPR